MDDDLKAVVSIETALKHHIRPVLEGDQIRLLKTTGYEQANKEDVELVTKILRSNKAELLRFLTSKEQVEARLRSGQQKLIEDNGRFLRDMEWWDKLERVYEAVWPAEGCITGDDRCPDTAIVRCSYCATAGISQMVEE